MSFIEADLPEEIPVDSIIRAFRRQKSNGIKPKILEPLAPSVPLAPSAYFEQKDDHLLHVAKENNLDDLVSNLSEEIIRKTRDQSNRALQGSNRYRYAANFLRFLAILTGIASGVMGIQGINNVTGDGNAENTLVFAVGIVINLVTIISEVLNGSKLRERSVKLKKYHNKFETFIVEARRIKVDDLSPFEALDALNQIQDKVNDLDLKMFNNEFTRKRNPDTLVTCTADHRCVVSRQNAQIFKRSRDETPVGDNHQPQDIHRDDLLLKDTEGSEGTEESDSESDPPGENV